MFKIVFITLLLINTIKSSSTLSSNLRSTQRVNTIKRTLKLGNNIKPIPCNPGTNGTSCICPNINCLEYSEKNNGCHPIDCWKWNEINMKE